MNIDFLQIGSSFLCIYISSQIKSKIVQIARNKNETKCFYHHKDKKLPFHWKPAVPRNCKKNVIVGHLHRANKISSALEKEVSIIKAKYLKAGYPNGFIDSILKLNSSDQRRFFHSIIII